MTFVTSFSGLSDMLSFLTAMGTDFFDSFTYDDDESPSKIVCTQDGHTILEVSLNGANWVFTPYIGDGTAASNPHIFNRPLEAAYRFSGGAYFESISVSGLKHVFAIAKTSAGKTGFILHTLSTTFNIATVSTFHPSCFGDDTNQIFYSSGYKIQGNAAAADRTILMKIPVAGAIGSTDYFTTVSVRNTVQFAETGNQQIGGKTYGCVKFLAFSDEEES